MPTSQKIGSSSDPNSKRYLVTGHGEDVNRHRVPTAMCSDYEGNMDGLGLTENAHDSSGMFVFLGTCFVGYHFGDEDAH